MNELFFSFFSFVDIRVIRGYFRCVIRSCVLCLLISSSHEAESVEAPSYKCLMRIPVDLITTDGVRLEKGQYELEVKPDAGRYGLSFSSSGHVKAVVRATRLASASIPLVGTHYLRSSAEPLLTGEERRFSKTGRTQYEEETRDWKATLRLYRSPPDSAFFVFQVRGPNRQWNHVFFQVSIVPK